MICGGAEEKKAIQAVQGFKESKETLETQREVQDLIRKEETLNRRAQEEKKPIDSEMLAQLSRHLPRLIQRALQKIEASTVYRTFKLAGRDYVVHDRREEKVESKKEEGKPDEGKKIKEESKKPLEEMILMRGKLSPAQEKGYENYLGEPLQRALMPEQQAAVERLLKLFSRFELMLLKRFEKGEEVAKPQPEGEKSFLKKTAEQWRNFFTKFVSRTIKRTVSVENLQEGLFRGLVQKQSRSTVISDLALADGQWEKFARFRLQGAEQQTAYLSQLPPGTRLSKEELRRLASGDLEYLVIKQAEGSDAAWVQAPQKGKFMESAQAEARVASDLGLQMGEQFKEKERLLREAVGRKKGGGLGGGFFGEKGEGGENPREQFIPWWQYGLKKPAVRWGLAAFLFILFLGILFGLSALF